MIEGENKRRTWKRKEAEKDEAFVVSYKKQPEAGNEKKRRGIRRR